MNPVDAFGEPEMSSEKDPSRRMAENTEPACTADAIWQPGQVLFNGYRVSSVIGQGGMGIVHLVERPLSSRTLRFAMKTLKNPSSQDDECRRSFVSELRTWIDLPPHPNLNQCFFFRTIENRLAIFSEFVSGGSLREWIQSGRISSLAVILEIAIQIAEGLAIAHQSDVIHQDIKPSNILMTPEGVAKITDFGLSRIRAGNNRSKSTANEMETVWVECGGLTPAYCSPEQILGRQVSRKTDIYSFGVTLMEMIAGRANWKFSTVVPHLLKKWMEHPEDTTAVRIPRSMFDFLEGCLKETSSERWPDFHTIRDVIAGIYHEVTGKRYSSDSASCPILRLRDPSCLRPPTREGSIEWICDRMTRLHGIDPAIWEDQLPSPDAPPHSRDLAILDLLEHLLMIQARHEILPENDRHLTVANTYLTRAVVLDRLGDYEGSIESLKSCEKIISTTDSVLPKSDQNRLAVILLFFLGLTQHDPAQSHRHYSEATRLLDEYRDQFPDIEYLELKSSVLNNLGGVYYRLNDLPKALSAYSEANRLLDRALELDPRPNFILQSTNCKINHGVLCLSINRLEDAARQLDEATSRLESIRHIDSLRIKRLNASIEMHKALILQIRGNSTEAIDGFNRCIRILDETIAQGDYRNSEETRLKCCMNLAYSISKFDRLQDADRLLKTTILGMEDLIYIRGKFYLENDLALMKFNHADVQNRMGNPSEALNLIGQAIGIWATLYHEFNNLDALLYLAESYENRFEFVNANADQAMAEQSIRECIRLRGILMREQPDTSNAVPLARAHRKLAGILVNGSRKAEARAELDSALELLDDEIGRSLSQDPIDERNLVLALKQSL